jgi:hypothetical protein
VNVVPVICFAFVTAIAGTLLPISYSYADDATTDTQSCDSGSASTDPVTGCGEREHSPEQKGVDKSRKHD